MKLALAVKAILPLIACTTRDTVNFAEILAHVTKRKVKVWGPQGIKIEPKSVYYWLCPKGFNNRLPLESLYESCTNAESTLIIVNVNLMEPIFFDCGEVEVPKDMLHNLLNGIVENDKEADTLARSLGGCTLKEAVEFARLTMAETQALTADGVMGTRKSFFQPSKGLPKSRRNKPITSPRKSLQRGLKTRGDTSLLARINGYGRAGCS